MNAGTACPQCGTIANPNDKFCNTCGTRLPVPAAAPAPPPVAPPYGPPAQPPAYAPPLQGGPQYVQTPYPMAPQPGQVAPPRAARCQMGHEIAPGMSYCAMGHPIALDAMQFAGDPSIAATAFSPGQGFAPPPGYGAQPAPQPVPMAPPPQAAPPMQPMQPAQGFGVGAAPQPPMYAPQPVPQPGYAPPPPGYAPPPQPAYAPPPQQGVFQPAAVVPGAAPGYPPPAPQGYAGAPAAPVAAAVNVKQLRAFLVSFQANPQGDFWPLYTGRTSIGRANAGEPADVPLADATISSRHAALTIDMNAVIVEDTNSTNGTYVNEEHIGMNGKRELRDGDRVRFGGYTTIVKVLGRTG